MFDPKRAREIAEMCDRCGCQGIDQHEAAAMLRAAAEIVEKLPRTTIADGVSVTIGDRVWCLSERTPQAEIYEGEIIRIYGDSIDLNAGRSSDLDFAYSTRAAASSAAKEQA